MTKSKMLLSLDPHLADSYISKSQKIRIITEAWVSNNIFCPNCSSGLTKYPNNLPVADFFCAICHEDYELKSKKGKISKKIVAGSYESMIKRLKSSTNPNLFLLSYNPVTWNVTDFLCIPKHFFTQETIEKRKPLKETARRSGWIGCNILVDTIPESGRIPYVIDKVVVDSEVVLKKWQSTLFLRDVSKNKDRGWLIDVMRIIESLNQKEFTLADLYNHEESLSRLHPNNNHTRAKIRQQLQILRRREYLVFVSPGVYRLA